MEKEAKIAAFNTFICRLSAQLSSALAFIHSHRSAHNKARAYAHGDSSNSFL